MHNIKKVGLLLIALLLSGFATSAIPPAKADDSFSLGLAFASGSFRNLWERADLPVYLGRANRSYTWGPEAWSYREEPYEESPGKKRLVQYLDKARMEINSPLFDPTVFSAVSNGLLVKEMIAGRVQEGDNKFREVTPSEVPVAGDPANNPGPTYRSFQRVSAIVPGTSFPRRNGGLVRTTIDKEGRTGENEDFNFYNIRYSQYIAETGRNIADVFWDFMTRSDTVYEVSFFFRGPVINWVSAMGLPLTEPFWTRSNVAGREQAVLVQLFERRVLTYTPTNPEGFRVEMGNVGAHYFSWRYPGLPRVTTWANIKFTNTTTCSPVTLSLRVQDYFTMDLPANGSRTFRVAPGNYQYRASGCQFLPVEAAITFTAGQQAELRLFLTAAGPQPPP